ncbi:NAD(P)-dependent oxidoreductase [Nocardioides euryhalodurans]|uniref:NAD(P)-dependent oxidoreductase n=1 Tax=Nocardioides euryhalodurans TaxID=2518370 RepID=A0A4P7GNX6_9ACTN|nr:NAD(P)-dependent oxidoreductase [Nocardioides euryhalodurans]QBR93481.1 NAD(P)-dependent oxidoreductase [Nocardioides euryhalodurans]
MAARVLAGGHDVVAWDVDPDRVGSLAADGARAARTAADLADCRVVLVVVPDDDAVTELLSGPDALLALLPAGAVVVVHSTVLPPTVTALAAEGLRHGVHVLDAPVSGGPDRAAEGDLTLMVGGEAAAVARVRPVLGLLGPHVHHVGGTGAGSAVKLANQTMLFSALAGAHEGMALAAAYGVAEQDVLDVVATSLGESWVTRNWGFFDDMVRTYDEIGTPPEQRSWRKDLRDVVLTAEDRGLDLPVARLLAATLADRVEGRAARGGGEQPEG